MPRASHRILRTVPISAETSTVSAVSSVATTVVSS